MKNEDYIYSSVTPQCSECDEYAVVWWPAYDPDSEPKPYCNKHLEAAKKVYSPTRPKFLQMNTLGDKVI